MLRCCSHCDRGLHAAGPEFLANRQTILKRRDQVKDDDVGSTLRGEAQGLIAVSGAPIIVACDTEAGVQSDAVPEVVLDHQDALGRRRPIHPATSLSLCHGKRR